MKEDRSPCIECEKVKQSKFECAESCETLKAYQQKLPGILSGGETLVNLASLVSSATQITVSLNKSQEK